MAGFSMVIGLACVGSLISSYLVLNIKTITKQITEDAIPGMNKSANMRESAAEAQLAVLRYIMTQDVQERTQFLGIINENAAIVAKEIAAYEKTISREEDRAEFNKLAPIRSAYVKARQDLFDLGISAKSEDLALRNKQIVRPLYAQFQGALDSLFDHNAEYGDISSTLINSRVKQALSLTIGLCLISLLIGATLALVITKSLTRKLGSISQTLAEGADNVASASGQISSASQTLANGAGDQAASLEETSASLEEMASMTQRNSDNAEKAKTLTVETRAVAETGSADMREMTKAMDEIKGSSDNIAKIIKTIDEIAFQTNILALNAAVEAARAGESGMGFAVVADEVRNLAQRSAAAAKDTAALIEDSINKSARGVILNAKVGQELADIASKSRQVDDLVGEITMACREQSQGISQINLAVSQMDKVTQANAASAEESASASVELNGQAMALKQTMSELEALVGNHSKGQLLDEHKQIKPEPKAMPSTHHRTISQASSRSTGQSAKNTDFVGV